MSYRLVYDVTTAGPSVLSIVFLVVGVVLTIIATVLVRWPELMRVSVPGRPIQAEPSKRPWYFLALALVFTFFALGMADGGQSELQTAALRGDCKPIEGLVSDYTLTRGRKTNESFRVQGVYFEYGDFRGTGAFNQTARYGGPIKPGLPVRICYHQSERLDENLILRLEIAE